MRPFGPLRRVRRRDRAGLSSRARVVPSGITRPFEGSTPTIRLMVFRAASSGALQSSALAVLSLILIYALDRSVGSFVLVLIFLSLGSWRITRSLFRART